MWIRVRAAASATVTATSDIRDTIGAISDASAAIADAVEAQTAVTRDIAARVSAVSRTTAGSAEAMGQLVRVADAANEASQKVVTGAGSVGSDTATLRTEVERFLVTVRADSSERRRFERFQAGAVPISVDLPDRAGVAAALV